MDDVLYERVSVPTTSPFVLRDFIPGRANVEMSAELYRPATGTAPFPAVVVSQGLGGVKTARERRYGRFLAQHGFVALVVDSFRTRGLHTWADPIRAINVTEAMMLADAFAGLTWLAARDDVDAEHIGHIGFSYGGMICILTVYEQIRRHFVESDEKFATHVSYYGPTVPRLVDYRTTGAPVAILNGALDNNFNPHRSEMIAQDLKNGGSAVENIVYEGVYHQWDSDDHERRFDLFNIKALGTRIEPDQRVFDERTGIEVKGFGSRLWMIARSVSLRGFHLQRDPDVMRQSDDVLLRYLAIGAAQTVPVDATPSTMIPAASASLPPALAKPRVRSL